MTKQMKSPKKALPYKKLLDYFRDEPNYMGKGAKGRILEEPLACISLSLAS